MTVRFAVASGARLAAIGILAGLAGVLATTSLQQDFAAYYTAGAAANLGLDPYLNQLPAGGPWDGVSIYRHSRFLYPPLLAQFFRPLGALPFAWAKAIFTAASVTALVVALRLAARDAASERGTDREAVRRMLPLPIAIWVPVFLSLERGQIDLLLMVPLAAAWHWRRREPAACPSKTRTLHTRTDHPATPPRDLRSRPLAAGALLALAIMAKPLALGVLPLLLCGRQFRWAAAAAAALVLLGVATVAICGTAQSFEYASEVLPRAVQYGEGGPEALLLGEAQLERASDDLARGVARVDGRGHAYAQEIGTFRRNASLPRLLAGDGGTSAWVGIVALLVLGAPLAFAARRSPRCSSWYWGGLLAALIASPISWAMGLVWALPLFSLGPAGTEKSDRASRALLAVAFVAGTVGPLFSLAWVLAGLAGVAAAVTIASRRTAIA